MYMKDEESSAVEYVFRSRAVFLNENHDRELRERTMQSMINILTFMGPCVVIIF
jgi:hypothetical protein